MLADAVLRIEEYLLAVRVPTGRRVNVSDSLGVREVFPRPGNFLGCCTPASWISLKAEQ
jgi:hypothetical protein